jgi:hypothetical protein
MQAKDVILGMKVLIIRDDINFGKTGIVRKIELTDSDRTLLGIKIDGDEILLSAFPEAVELVITGYTPYKGDKIYFPYKEGSNYLKAATVQDFGQITSLGKYLIFVGFTLNGESYYTTIWSDQVVKN